MSERASPERRYGKVSLALARALILRRPLSLNNTVVSELPGKGYWAMSHVVSMGWDGEPNYAWLAMITPLNKLTYVLSGEHETSTATTRTMALRLRALMYLLGVEREHRITTSFMRGDRKMTVMHNARSLARTREVFEPIGMLSLCAIRCALEQEYPEVPEVPEVPERPDRSK